MTLERSNFDHSWCYCLRRIQYYHEDGEFAVACKNSQQYILDASQPRIKLLANLRYVYQKYLVV